MEKRVLILAYNNHLNSVGGVELYTKKIINILINNNCKVFEINFYQSENNNSNKFKEKYIKNYELIDNKIKFEIKKNCLTYLPILVFKLLSYVFKLNRLINKIIKDKKIDIVIDETTGIRYSKKKNIDYI